MKIPVKLQVFEGPLDLLLHLIDKNKIDIYDIPIVEITQQYMTFIKEMEEENLDVMSEFLVMAATLLEIKCKMLLPAETNEEGEEEDPRLALVEQLIQYKMFKLMASGLKDLQQDGEHLMFKTETLPEEIRDYVEPVNLDELLSDVNLHKLNKIFKEVMKRREDKVDPIRSKFGKIEKEDIPLPDMLLYVEDYCKEHKKFSFRELLEQQNNKLKMVVTFLAILELMKVGVLQVSQEGIGEEIFIEAA